MESCYAKGMHALLPSQRWQGQGLREQQQGLKQQTLKVELLPRMPAQTQQ
jgi:hypothetical protein